MIPSESRGGYSPGVVMTLPHVNGARRTSGDCACVRPPARPSARPSVCASERTGKELRAEHRMRKKRHGQAASARDDGRHARFSESAPPRAWVTCGRGSEMDWPRRRTKALPMRARSDGARGRARAASCTAATDHHHARRSAACHATASTAAPTMRAPAALRRRRCNCQNSATCHRAALASCSHCWTRCGKVSCHPPYVRLPDGTHDVRALWVSSIAVDSVSRLRRTHEEPYTSHATLVARLAARAGEHRRPRCWCRVVQGTIRGRSQQRRAKARRHGLYDAFRIVKVQALWNAVYREEGDDGCGANEERIVNH
jgi:hypothetical protein